MPIGGYRFRRSFGNVASQFRGARPDTYPLFSGLLDTYPGAAAAFSLRELSTDFVGQNLILARRTTDPAERGFTASEISGGDLATWSQGGDVFVVTWYDQSGNSADVTQPTPTDQPKIVDTGVLVDGGLSFDGVDDILLSSVNFTSSQPITAIHLSTTNQAATTAGVLNISTGINTPELNSFYRSDGGFAINAGATLTSAPTTTYATGTDYLRFDVYNTTSSEIFANESSVASGSAGTNSVNNKIVIGGFQVFSLDGTIQEVILYPSDQTASREGIESNIKNAYD